MVPASPPDRRALRPLAGQDTSANGWPRDSLEAKQRPEAGGQHLRMPHAPVVRPPSGRPGTTSMSVVFGRVLE